MCLGTVGQITAVGADRCVQVRAGDREITASLLALSETVGRVTGCSCTRDWCWPG